MKKLFNGRINRSMFIYGIGSSLIVATIVYLLNKLSPSPIIFLILIILIDVFIISLDIRRLHDLGYSGWWILVGLLPIVNTFCFLYLLVKGGHPKQNKYGPQPMTKHLF